MANRTTKQTQQLDAATAALVSKMYDALCAADRITMCTMVEAAMQDYANEPAADRAELMNFHVRSIAREFGIAP